MKFYVSRVFLLAVMMVAACTFRSQDSSPVKVLESYIETSFNIKNLDDKKKMEEMLTGDTKQRLVSWSDEQFIKAFIETKRKFIGIKVLENKKVNEKEAALTYELTFQEGEADKTAKISQRKLCVVVEEGSQWKIKEVRSIRESIEYLKELSLP